MTTKDMSPFSACCWYSNTSKMCNRWFPCEFIPWLLSPNQPCWFPSYTDMCKRKSTWMSMSPNVAYRVYTPTWNPLYMHVNKTCMICFIPGLLMGRLRVPDQLDSHAHPGSDDHREIQSSYLCCVHHRVLPGNHPINADLICRLPACTVQWTHGCEYSYIMVVVVTRKESIFTKILPVEKEF